MMTETELNEIEVRAQRATAGPWFVHRTDDEQSQGALYVGTPYSGGDHDNRRGMGDGAARQANPVEVIAITLLQHPNLCGADECEENTSFIAQARSDVPRLVAEVRALKEQLRQRGVAVE